MHLQTRTFFSENGLYVRNGGLEVLVFWEILRTYKMNNHLSLSNHLISVIMLILVTINDQLSHQKETNQWIGSAKQASIR